MNSSNLTIVLFACFAFGLPLWAMQNNGDGDASIHSCTGQCYQEWKKATGGTLALAEAKAQARAEASPEELGKERYIGCVACHGAAGEGGVGPVLAGRSASDIASMLSQYKQGETRGSQSALMWSQAAQLSAGDIGNLAAYIETL